MSKTKAGGSTRNGRDSQSNRLGVKLFGSQIAKPGDIIVRQRGTKFEGGKNTGIGVDHTIYAKSAGQVAFSRIQKTLFTGSTKRKTIVSIEPTK